MNYNTVVRYKTITLPYYDLWQGDPGPPGPTGEPGRDGEMVQFNKFLKFILLSYIFACRVPQEHLAMLAPQDQWDLLEIQYAACQITYIMCVAINGSVLHTP